MPATTSNDLICFTNCFLPQEDGGLIEKDLWIDERRGVILDAQVGLLSQVWIIFSNYSCPANFFLAQGASE
jgi:hypothetical protein